MPQKSDQTPSIKDFVSTLNKESGRQKGQENKSNKQTSKNVNMIKEAGTGTKSNTQKTPKPNKRDTDTLTTNKRDASTRSPLEENPRKKL